MRKVFCFFCKEYMGSDQGEFYTADELGLYEFVCSKCKITHFPRVLE